jgi:hypothetical protein
MSVNAAVLLKVAIESNSMSIIELLEESIGVDGAYELHISFDGRHMVLLKDEKHDREHLVSEYLNNVHGSNKVSKYLVDKRLNRC